MFVVMVLLSAYTANLAQFMTTRAEAVSSISSLSALLASGGAACVYNLDPSLPALRSLHPSLPLLEYDSSESMLPPS